MTGRPLDAAERALWDRLVATVKPLHVRTAPAPIPPEPTQSVQPIEPRKPKGRVPPPRANAATARSAAPPILPGGLDSHWDRRLARGAIQPELSVDLHGHGIASAYARLDAALEMAVADGMRAILLVTGRARAHDRASGEGRGAIRAAVADWLAASRHERHIAAVRQAHPRHGGEGALYIILRRRD